jgi:hypothetical protein
LLKFYFTGGKEQQWQQQDGRAGPASGFSKTKW